MKMKPEFELLIDTRIPYLSATGVHKYLKRGTCLIFILQTSLPLLALRVLGLALSWQSILASLFLKVFGMALTVDLGLALRPTFEKACSWLFWPWPWRHRFHNEFNDTLVNINLILNHFQVIKPPLSTARAALCNVLSICSSVCPIVCLSPKYENAIFSKTKQFRAMVSIDEWRPIGSRTWAFQRTHNWTPKIQDDWDPPFCKFDFSAEKGPIWIKFR